MPPTTPQDDIVGELSQILLDRQSAAPDHSYVASLYDKGLNKILEKVGEEATEVILASRDLAQGTPGAVGGATAEPSEKANERPISAESALIGEVADLWFHTMVMLTHQGVPPGKVLDELARRFGVSGFEEKRNR